MSAPLGMYPLDRSTPSLQRVEPMLGGSPAPAGALFVLGDNGGYGAAPRPANRLILGRNTTEVHVTVGAGDWCVSRAHAVVRCMTHGSDVWWTLHNVGRRPIRMPAAPLLLQEHRALLPPGYTPLYFHGERLHLVEVLVSAGPRGKDPAPADGRTRDFGWPLTDRQRLVLVAVFQDFLHRAETAHPLSWNETSKALNRVPGQRDWTPRRAENVVDGIRHELSAAGVPRLTADTAHPEMIKLNLLQYLLDTATLVPADLHLLDGDQ